MRPPDASVIELDWTPRGEGLFRLDAEDWQSAHRAAQRYRHWKREARVGEEITWGDPNADDKDERGRWLTESSYANRPARVGPPAPYLVPFGHSSLYTRHGRLNTRGRYRLKLVNAFVGGIYRTDTLRPGWDTPQILLLRWGPQGNRLDVNGGSKKRVFKDPGGEKAFYKSEEYKTLQAELNARSGEKPWHKWAELGDAAAIKADFLRQGGWHPQKAGATGNARGRPRAGATSHELIRQRIEASSSRPIEDLATILRNRRKRTEPEKVIYDEFAWIVAGLVDSGRPVNRGSLAEVLACSRRSIDRLVERGRSCRRNALTGEEGIFDGPPA